MDQQETKNLYLLLPAATSGDLWHVAAAQILSSRYAKDDGFNFNIVVAMVCSKNGHGVQGSQKQVEDQENFQKLERKVGSNSFNYFRNIGLPRLLIEVEVAQPSKTNLERTISGLSNKFLDDTYHAQRDLRWSFEDMLNKEELLGKFPSQHKVDETSEPSRILKLMTATTIAMNFLCHQNGSKVDGSRYTYLRQRMCTANINSTEKDVEAEANERYEKLKAVVKQLLEEKVNGQPKYKQVVLENYRTNRTNYQTDSNPTLSNFFREFAEKLQMAVIQIPAVHNTNRLVQLTDPVFDFYGIKDGKAYPGVEARAQCRFWAKVAEDREIAGIFGGRTGSIDVSGFNGMNVFFWDEPWIEWSASSLDLTNAKELGPNNKSGRSTAAKQVPQCLRSLQLLPIMAVGCPTNIRTVKGSDGAPDRTFWDKIQEEQLKEWFSRLGKDPKDRNFELEKAIYPKLPEVKTWRLGKTSLNDYTKTTQESPAYNIKAHVLEFVKYQSDVVNAGNADDQSDSAAENTPASSQPGSAKKSPPKSDQPASDKKSASKSSQPAPTEKSLPKSSQPASTKNTSSAEKNTITSSQPSSTEKNTTTSSQPSSTGGSS